MVIVETPADFEEMQRLFSKSVDLLVIPIFVDEHGHPAVTPLSFLYVTDFANAAIVPFAHYDALPAPSTRIAEFTVWAAGYNVGTPDTKKLMHGCPGIWVTADLHLNASIYGETLPELDTYFSPVMKTMVGTHRDRANINSVMPLMKWAECLQAYTTDVWKYLDVDAGTRAFVQNTIIPTCQFMESRGIHVASDAFLTQFRPSLFNREMLLTHELVYCEYNPYTTTGRVTNRFDGINYTALNKHDATRRAFTSRFSNGAMVLIDYESFHLHLIADLIGFTAPPEPFHEYLAKQYFQTTELTPEQYEEGKKITFRNLYSDDRDESIPFFRAVTQMVQRTWVEFERHQVLAMAEGRLLDWKDVPSPSPSKMFNYILQWQETVTVFRQLAQIVPLYTDKTSAIPLYTYDSILIDYNFEDGRELLLDTVRVLSAEGRYPVRIYVGPSYHSDDLKNVTKSIFPN